jgi:hypothetical protein
MIRSVRAYEADIEPPISAINAVGNAYEFAITPSVRAEATPLSVLEGVQGKDSLLCAVLFVSGVAGLVRGYCANGANLLLHREHHSESEQTFRL